MSLTVNSTRILSRRVTCTPRMRSEYGYFGTLQPTPHPDNDSRYSHSATGWTIGGSNPGTGEKHFPFSKTSRLDLGSTQPPLRRISEFFPGVKRPGREVGHPPPASAKVKNKWSYTSASPIRLHSAVSEKFTSVLYSSTFCTEQGKDTAV